MTTISKAEKETEIALPSFSSSQQTLLHSATFSGIGLFTGQEITVRISPARVNHGIVFCRSDLPGKPLIPAHVDCVQSALRCTKLGLNNASIQTVEHLLAALRACKVDNALIDVNGPEVPALDGSAKGFIEKIEEADLMEQEEACKTYYLEYPVYWSSGEVHLVALPSDSLQISYTLHFPSCSSLGTQFYSYILDKESFKHEIAPCRTFAIYEEIAPFIKKGYIKGGALDNAIVFKENMIINPEGLRFNTEPARHKILDLIGDLYLTGKQFNAHIIAIRSGHASNTQFAKQLTFHLKERG